MKLLRIIAFAGLFIVASTVATAQSTAPSKPRVNSKMKYVKSKPATPSQTVPAPPAPRADAPTTNPPATATPATDVMQARVKKMGKLQKKTSF